MNEFEWIKKGKYDYYSYCGQELCLRTLAVEKYGAEKVSLMSSEQIEREFLKEGLIPVVLNHDGNNQECVFLIPFDYLKTCACLRR